MNVVIACGGTGGHLFPGLAVAETLRDRGHQVLVFISEKQIDAVAVRDHQTQFRFEKLPAIGMPRVFSPAMLSFIRGFSTSLLQCRKYYRDFRPHAVLGMGGFTSTGPMLAGRLARIPTFIHESNAIPGKANRVNARLAKVVLLGFEQCARYFPRNRCEVTGTPIRAELRQSMNRQSALAAFGFHESTGKKTLLVMGGSQGAHGINDAVLRSAAALKNAVQIIHLTGREDEAAIRTSYEKVGVTAFVAAFHHRMQEAYIAADLAVARSGAASLSELAFFGLPSLLIPYPHAAEDHQTFNAKIFSESGAAVMLHERELVGDKLAADVVRAIQNPDALAAMAAAAQRLSPSDAAERLVNILERECSL